MSCAGGPDLVQNGLVLCLDAADKQSYSGSGNTWTDISNNGNNGTLTNSPTFNSSNKGNIAFNGTNNFINTSYTLPNTNYTISIAFKINVFSTTYNRGIFSTFSTSNFNGIYFADSGSQSISTSNMWFWADGNSLYRIPYIFATNTWYFVAFSIINGEIYVYINGGLVYQVTNTTTHQNTLNLGISRFDQNYLNGNISLAQVYNRALSANEILQNYKALKGRFLLI